MLFFDNIKFLNVEYFFNLIYRVPVVIFDFFANWGAGVVPADLWWLMALIKIIFYFIVIAIFAWFFYIIYKLVELWREDKEKYALLFIKLPEKEEKKRRVNQRWEDVQAHLAMDNVPSWTTAVIDCDKILDDLLRERGYQGQTTGDLLKAIPEGGLRNIQDAWDAHKIRNNLAHDSNFVITRRIASEAVSMYETVFRELGFLE